MKNPYFTDDSIQDRSREIMKSIEMYRENRPFRIEAERSALIILDMQDYFLNERSHAFIPSSRAIIPGILELIDRYQSLELPVYVTRHLNTANDAESLGRWWNDTIQENNDLSNLAPEIEATGAPIIRKSQYDAFFGTNLEEELRKNGVTQLVIGGVMTHLCCETTARSAFVRGFEVFFLVDGTATYNIEFHKATLLTLSHGFVHPVEIREVLEELSDVEGNDDSLLDELIDALEGE